MSMAPLPFVDVNPTSGEPDALVIWLHGLGDSGNGFAPIVAELDLPASAHIRFVFPHAPVRPITINNGMPMRGWYDIKSLDFNQRADMPGVLESAEAVTALLDSEMSSGIPSERVVLAGFSQGGVIALHVAARLPIKLAGVIALSTYLSQPEALASEATSVNKDTPFFCGHGTHDDVVPLNMGKAAFDTLTAAGYQPEWYEYPMQHNVCAPQLQDLSRWFAKVFA